MYNSVTPLSDSPVLTGAAAEGASEESRYNYVQCRVGVQQTASYHDGWGVQ